MDHPVFDEAMKLSVYRHIHKASISASVQSVHLPGIIIDTKNMCTGALMATVTNFLWEQYQKGCSNTTADGSRNIAVKDNLLTHLVFAVCTMSQDSRVMAVNRYLFCILTPVTKQTDNLHINHHTVCSEFKLPPHLSSVVVSYMHKQLQAVGQVHWWQLALS